MKNWKIDFYKSGNKIKKYKLPSGTLTLDDDKEKKDSTTSSVDATHPKGIIEGSDFMSENREWPDLDWKKFDIGKALSTEPSIKYYPFGQVDFLNTIGIKGDLNVRNHSIGPIINVANPEHPNQPYTYKNWRDAVLLELPHSYLNAKGLQPMLTATLDNIVAGYSGNDETYYTPGSTEYVTHNIRHVYYNPKNKTYRSSIKNTYKPGELNVYSPTDLRPIISVGTDGFLYYLLQYSLGKISLSELENKAKEVVANNMAKRDDTFFNTNFENNHDDWAMNLKNYGVTGKDMYAAFTPLANLLNPWAQNAGETLAKTGNIPLSLGLTFFDNWGNLKNVNKYRDAQDHFTLGETLKGLGKVGYAGVNIAGDKLGWLGHKYTYGTGKTNNPNFKLTFTKSAYLDPKLLLHIGKTTIPNMDVSFTNTAPNDNILTLKPTEDKPISYKYSEPTIYDKAFALSFPSNFNTNYNSSLGPVKDTKGLFDDKTLASMMNTVGEDLLDFMFGSPYEKLTPSSPWYGKPKRDYIRFVMLNRNYPGRQWGSTELGVNGPETVSNYEYSKPVKDFLKFGLTKPTYTGGFSFKPILNTGVLKFKF